MSEQVTLPSWPGIGPHLSRVGFLTTKPATCHQRFARGIGGDGTGDNAVTTLPRVGLLVTTLVTVVRLPPLARRNLCKPWCEPRTG